jgi:hypothetical protein
MFNRLPQRSIVAAILTLGVGLFVISPSYGNGPCGQDFDGNQACGIASPATDSGSLITDNESDYYVFFAQKGTELSVAVTDTEDPTCDPLSCGSAHVELLEADGDDTFQGASSAPNNGITVAGNLAHTLEATGTYYLVVSGYLGHDENYNPTPIPYTLSINASPAVQWPAPAPTHKVRHCTFRRTRHHGHVLRVKTCKTIVVAD